MHGIDAVLLPQIISADGQTFVVGNGEGGEETFTLTASGTPDFDLNTGLGGDATQGSVMTSSISN